MAINSIIGSASSASAKYEEINISIKKTTVELNSTDAAVFTKTADEQSADKNKLIGKPADPETIERLKAEADERFAQLKGIVEKLLLKQGGTLILRLRHRLRPTSQRTDTGELSRPPTGSSISPRLSQEQTPTWQRRCSKPSRKVSNRPVRHGVKIFPSFARIP